MARAVTFPSKREPEATAWVGSARVPRRCERRVGAQSLVQHNHGHVVFYVPYTWEKVMLKLIRLVVAVSMLVSLGLARAEGDGDDESSTARTKAEASDTTQGSASGEPEHRGDERENQGYEPEHRGGEARLQNGNAATWWSGGGT